MTKSCISLFGFLSTLVIGVILQLHPVAGAQQKPLVGYEDTPLLPDAKWHVHDGKRPQPRVIAPSTCSTQGTPGQPPSDAVVLFNGNHLSQWQTEKGGPAAWKVENGYTEVVPRAGDILTRDQFGDIQLHVEWRTPGLVRGESPGYGNSGIFLFGVYEVQVFESSRDLIYADGQAGAIYGQYPPLVNASLKPGDWQVFEILFTAPRFEGGKLATPAYLTVLQNGAVIHNHTAVLGETGHRILPRYVDRGPKGPIRLQDHGDLVRYRNIWVRPLKGYDEP